MAGVDYPIGSFEESLAVLAINRNKQVHFMTTLLIVNAIIHVGNCIQAAVAGSSASEKGSENIQKLVDSLRSMLLPGDDLDTESKTQRSLRILEEEVSKGPLNVRPMAETKADRGRIKRLRSK